jgi:predicted phage-related endonuclease
MSTAPAIVHSPRAQWLLARHEHVGASELAAIVDADPRRGWLSIYAAKVEQRLDEDESSWLAFGRDVETAIAKGYEHKTGREVIDLGAFDFVRHPRCARLGATLDRRCHGSSLFPTPAGATGEGALELKAVGFHKAHEWHEEPPLHYVVQVQAQMACAQLRWGSLGALFGGISIADPVDLLPDPAFMEAALVAVDRFWWHVEHRVPPPADAKPDTVAAIKRLWANDNGATVPLDEQAARLVAEWEKAKAAESAAECEAKAIDTQLRALLGAATFGELPDGSLLTLKKVERAGYAVKPTSYRTLKHTTPRIPRRR